MVSAFVAVSPFCASQMVFDCFFPFKLHVFFTLARVVRASLFFTDFGGFRGSFSGPLALGNEKTPFFGVFIFGLFFASVFFASWAAPGRFLADFGSSWV